MNINKNNIDNNIIELISPSVRFYLINLLIALNINIS